MNRYDALIKSGRVIATTWVKGRRGVREGESGC